MAVPLLVYCDDLGCALEAGVVVAPEVDGLAGFFIAEGALDILHP